MSPTKRPNYTTRSGRTWWVFTYRALISVLFVFLLLGGTGDGPGGDSKGRWPGYLYPIAFAICSVLFVGAMFAGSAGTLSPGVVFFAGLLLSIGALVVLALGLQAIAKDLSAGRI